MYMFVSGDTYLANFYLPPSDLPLDTCCMCMFVLLYQKTKKRSLHSVSIGISIVTPAHEPIALPQQRLAGTPDLDEPIGRCPLDILPTQFNPTSRLGDKWFGISSIKISPSQTPVPRASICLVEKQQAASFQVE